MRVQSHEIEEETFNVIQSSTAESNPCKETISLSQMLRIYVRLFQRLYVSYVLACLTNVDVCHTRTLPRLIQTEA